MAENIKNMFNSISLLKTILMKNGVELKEIESKRGIFQGDALYSITFHHCSDAS